MIVLADKCTHTVKVTRIPGKGYGVRVYLDGVLNQEEVVQDRCDIGPAARSMLRVEDKCGNISEYADRARHRGTEKALRLRASTQA